MRSLLNSHIWCSHGNQPMVRQACVHTVSNTILGRNGARKADNLKMSTAYISRLHTRAGPLQENWLHQRSNITRHKGWSLIGKCSLVSDSLWWVRPPGCWQWRRLQSTASLSLHNQHSQAFPAFVFEQPKAEGEEGPGMRLTYKAWDDLFQRQTKWCAVC